MNRAKLILLGILVVAGQRGWAIDYAFGGGALVCPGEVLSFDLFEGEIPGVFSPEGLKIVTSDTPVDEQISAAIEKLKSLDSEFGKRVESQFHHLKSVTNILKPGLTVPTPIDMASGILKENCILQGVASYDRAKDKLWLADGYYQRMSPTHQAAVWIHQALYKVLRGDEITRTSKTAQEWTALTFAEGEYPRGNISAAGPIVTSNGEHENIDLNIVSEISRNFHIAFITTTPELTCGGSGHVWRNRQDKAAFDDYLNFGDVHDGWNLPQGGSVKLAKDIQSDDWFYLGFTNNSGDDPGCKYEFVISDMRNSPVATMPAYQPATSRFIGHLYHWGLL